MALTSKTITVPIPTYTTSVATNTRLDFPAVTVTIPETASRTFRSVAIKIYARDDETTSGKYISNVLIGCTLDSAAADDATVVASAFNQYSQSEHQGLQFVRTDAALVSYFNANFGAGTTQTLAVSFKVQTMATINLSAVVEITYEYDDASVTTVNAMAYIPLESTTTSLTNTLAALAASGNIPQLTGTGGVFDGLNSVSIKSMSLIITGNEAPTNTTDFQLGMQIDSGSEVLDGNHRQNLQSAVFYQYVWDVSSMTTTTAHTLNLRTTATGKMNLAGALLVVQFTYNWSAGSVAWCGLRMPMVTEEGFGASASSGDRSVLALDFDVQDPATLAMQQSGVLINYVGNYRNNWTLSCLIGSQSARSYTSSIGSAFSTTVCGSHWLVQRFDSGGVQGSGLSLVRGKNSLRVGFYSGTSDPRVAGFSAMVYLNYRCGKAATEGKQTHTIWHGIFSTTLTSSSNLRTITSVAPVVSLVDYAMVNVGIEVLSGIYTGGSGVMVRAERLSGEGIADGWVSVHSQMYAIGTASAVFTPFWHSISRYFNRWNSDIDTERMVITTSRGWRFMSPIEETLFAAGLYLTVHGITYTVADAVTGLAAPVAGNTIDIHTAPADDILSPRIATTTTDSGGNFTVTVHDNTRDLFTKVIQSSTKQGISYTGKAV